MRAVTYVQLLVIPWLFLMLMQNDSCGKKKTGPAEPSVAKATPSAVANERPASPEDISRRVVQPGAWGGLHVNLEVSDGAATFDFDCAHGTITQSIALDPDGNFDVPGEYITEGPGPVREGDNAQSRVHYSGKVSADSMTLVIRRDRSDDELGRFTLIRGKQGKIMKCY
ncbi:MAG TPA: hypothetical protein VMZ30_18750 [Pyrinomonadaceae bacterium]|nr:hypothetical protein [Pyrinomonadaceae bacterium]